MSRRPLAVGDVIHGFAHGAFGRDHYHCVRIEAAGPDWIVARDPDAERDGPSFTSGRVSLTLCQQARDEGHQTPYGEPPEACPLGEGEPPLTVIADSQRCSRTGCRIRLAHGHQANTGEQT